MCVGVCVHILGELLTASFFLSCFFSMDESVMEKTLGSTRQGFSTLICKQTSESLALALSLGLLQRGRGTSNSILDVNSVIL